MKRHLIFWFVAATYLWTWSVNLPQLPLLGAHRVSSAATTLANFSQSIVALILIAIACGRAGLGELIRRLRPNWRDLALSAVAVVFAMGSTALAFLFYEGISGERPPLSGLSDLVGMTLILIPFTGLGEELGWRGFMLDRLQNRMSPASATWRVAVAWAVWHIPMLLRNQSEGDRTPALIALFVVGTIPLSFIFTALYNASRRQLLPVIVFHAAVDSSIGYFLGPVRRGDLRAFAMWIAIITVVALSVAVPRAWRRAPPPAASSDRNLEPRRFEHMPFDAAMVDRAKNGLAIFLWKSFRKGKRDARNGNPFSVLAANRIE